MEYEYNYTREMKQPRKLYKIGSFNIPFATNGVRLSHLVVGGVTVVSIVLLLVIGAITGIPLIQYVLVNGWVLLLAAIGAALWGLFSIKWDNKGVIAFLVGKWLFRQTHNVSYEHCHTVPETHHTAIHYKRTKQRR